MTRPMFPEGALTPLLLIGLVTIAGYCVQQSDWSRLVMPVAWVAFSAAVFGSVIAKLRVLDSIAHMLSMTLGIGLSFVLVATNAADLEGGVRERVREIGDVGLRWYLGQRVDDDMEALLVSLLMGIILWLVGYLAAWSLFRRGWILAAIALPGFLLLVNLGYAEVPQTGYLAAFAVVALILVSRHSLYSRQREWNRLNMGRPSGLVRGFLVTGVVVAIVATSAGWRSPASLSQETLQPLVGEVTSRALSAQETASDWLREVSGDPGTGIQTSGQFSTFGDTFSVGGPLELTDEPQVLVFADRAPYLTAQHYDAYSGRGWYSTTKESFDPEGIDGRRYSPEMTFAANQQVPLSPSVTQSRSTSAIEITPLAPNDGRLLTVDTFLASSVEASVRMSWLQLDDVEFDFNGIDISTLPRDIQLFASILDAADLSGEFRDGSPTAIDPENQSRIETEREQLRARFLDVGWAADESGAVTTLTVSGQLPVYDDVEAVFSDDAAVTGGTYRVLASTSTAIEMDLRETGTVYPEWVMERYLSLPETITPRTVALTQSIAAASDNPFDQARAIEQYLRTTIVYDETVEEPPDGADIVDYLLFERERGYCEYSASAMTVMLRSIGIPARVAVGFYPGDYDQRQAWFLYLQNNAHAWTEVFFPGYGWIPFEPTSSQPLIDSGTATEPDETLAEPSPIAELETPEPGTPAAEATPDILADDEAGIAPPQITPESGSGETGWGLFAAIGLAGVGAVVLAGWLLWILPLRGMSPSNSLFARLRRVGAWIGVSTSSTATPREYGQAFAERVPQAHNQVDRIVQMYELDQFGPDRADARWVGAAEDAWKSLRRQLPRWFVRWRR
ncbi:MAG: transglutaminase domain-containing protein [Chloroflexia bacterium]|nr:transglutaminase domain-containing protein [Chloroflexia bacterium]